MANGNIVTGGAVNPSVVASMAQNKQARENRVLQAMQSETALKQTAMQEEGSYARQNQVLAAQSAERGADRAAEIRGRIEDRRWRTDEAALDRELEKDIQDSLFKHETGLRNQSIELMREGMHDTKMYRAKQMLVDIVRNLDNARTLRALGERANEAETSYQVTLDNIMRKTEEAKALREYSVGVVGRVSDALAREPRFGLSAIREWGPKLGTESMMVALNNSLSGESTSLNIHEKAPFFVLGATEDEVIKGIAEGKYVAEDFIKVAGVLDGGIKALETEAKRKDIGKIHRVEAETLESLKSALAVRRGLLDKWITDKTPMKDQSFGETVGDYMRYIISRINNSSWGGTWQRAAEAAGPGMKMGDLLNAAGNSQASFIDALGMIDIGEDDPDFQELYNWSAGRDSHRQKYFNGEKIETNTDDLIIKDNVIIK